MFTYTLVRFRRILRETVALTTSPRVTLNRTRYVVVVEGAMHHVRCRFTHSFAVVARLCFHFVLRQRRLLLQWNREHRAHPNLQSIFWRLRRRSSGFA